MVKVFIKRIYDKEQDFNNYRVLVDRLWPRGISKERANLNEWAKDIAPSTELRKWFNHDPKKFKDFVKKYKIEIKNNKEADLIFKNWKKQKKIILLYGAKDETHNEAVVLKGILEEK